MKRFLLGLAFVLVVPVAAFAGQGQLQGQGQIGINDQDQQQQHRRSTVQSPDSPPWWCSALNQLALWSKRRFTHREFGSWFAAHIFRWHWRGQSNPLRDGPVVPVLSPYELGRFRVVGNNLFLRIKL